MKIDFDLESFLNKGAIFLNKKRDKLYVFYGKCSFQERRDPKKNQVFLTDYLMRRKKPFLNFEHMKSLQTKEFLSFIKKEQKSKPHFHFKEEGFLKYKKFYTSLMTLIHKKTLTKAVPYTFCASKLKTLNSKEKIYLLNSVLKYSLKHKTFFYAYFTFKKALIGSSPEIFLSKERSLYQTEAIAGTLKKTKLNRNKILHDKKLLKEQELVITSIRNSVSKLAEVKVSKKESLSLKSLIHIKNKITFKMKREGINIKELISLLHPTAALGSFPKEYWKKVEKMSPYLVKRQCFGSPIGYFHGKTSFLLVAIRALECFDEKAFLYAGGGLVSLSQLKSEWTELQLKLTEIKKILGL